MSNRKKTKATASKQLTLSGVLAQLAALQAGLGLSGAVFSRTERKEARSSSYRVPDGLIELVATHAENNGGAVAGLPFDAAAARDALTQVSTAQAAVRAARQFAQRVEDDATQRRSDVAGRAFAVYSALKRIVRLPEGKALKDTFDQMHSVVRAHQKAGTPKASAAAPKSVVAGNTAAPTTAPAAVAGSAPASTTSA